MKILIILLSLAVAAPAFGAVEGKSDSAASAKTEPAKENAKDAPSKGENAQAKDEAKNGKDEKEADIPQNEYSCKYYSVKLPDGWRAVMPPTEQAGVTNAIFTKSSDKTTVSILVGKSDGADGKTIAEMFAEQFKAPKPPVEKNGQFTFQYPQHDGATAEVTVTSGPREFMVVAVTGNSREARQFLRDNIKSEDYKDLLPQ